MPTRAFGRVQGKEAVLQIHDGRGHEGKDKDNKSEERAKPAIGIQGERVVDRNDTQEANTEEQHRPDVPAGPIRKISKGDKEERQNHGKDAMGARAEGAQDVATVELAGGQEIQRCREKPDPRSPTDGRQQESLGCNSGMKDNFKQAQQDRSAKNDFCVRGVGQSRNEFGVEDPVDERRYSENETHQRARGSDIKQRTVRPNGGSYENESAKGTDERGERNEKGIAGADVVVAAGEKVAEFVGE